MHTTRNIASSAVARVIWTGSPLTISLSAVDEAADMPPLVEILWPASGSEYEIVGLGRMARTSSAKFQWER